MCQLNYITSLLAALVVLSRIPIQRAFEWGMDGHMLINRLAGSFFDSSGHVCLLTATGHIAR
jgi:hypothetical protein